MRQDRRLRILILALVQAANAALALYACTVFILHRGADGGLIVNVAAFRYFTIDSNLLAALSALALLARLPGRWRGAPTPGWFWTLRLMSTVGVALTLATVMAFLAPIYGYDYMLDGPDLYLHLVCPLLHILSFVLLEREAGVPARRALWGLAPVLAYGVVYLLMVVVWRRWEDFYLFNAGGMFARSAVLMLLATAVLSLGLWFGNRRRTDAARP